MVETQPIDTSAPAPDRPERFAPSGWVAGLAAFVAYLVSSSIIFGGSVLAHLGTEYIPRQDASDSEFFRWALAWAPWAVTHGRDPLVTDVLHAPQGASLVWTTAVPGPALAMWPVTALFGPLVAYNVLCLLAPALAGWAAYLLCRRVSHRFSPSLAAGAVFGFSAYMTIQLNHPNLALTFPIPLLVYFTRASDRGLARIERVRGAVGRHAARPVVDLDRAVRDDHDVRSPRVRDRAPRGEARTAAASPRCYRRSASATGSRSRWCSSRTCCPRCARRRPRS